MLDLSIPTVVLLLKRQRMSKTSTVKNRWEKKHFRLDRTFLTQLLIYYQGFAPSRLWNSNHEEFVIRQELSSRSLAFFLIYWWLTAVYCCFPAGEIYHTLRKKMLQHFKFLLLVFLRTRGAAALRYFPLTWVKNDSKMKSLKVSRKNVRTLGCGDAHSQHIEYNLGKIGSLKTLFYVSRWSISAAFSKKSKTLEFIRNLSKKYSAELSKMHCTCLEEHFGKNDSKNYYFLLDFEQKFFGRVIKTAFYVCWGTFWGDFFGKWSCSRECGKSPEKKSHNIEGIIFLSYWITTENNNDCPQKILHAQ